ncbi:ribonuclease H-like domain-containing protein [Lactarius pseudohatsudake]|nr:ribonuclease H-like domain-containing protein [Lactarius pseudohatsudake]
MLCFEARILDETAMDDGMVIAGTREVVRSRSAIEDMGPVWAQGQADRTRGWLVSRTSTLVCHLRDCELQPRSVRERALIEVTMTSPVPSLSADPLAYSHHIPSRKVLTQRLIPATLKGFKQTARKQCSGFEGTVSYDGWTGGNHHHYVAFMNHVIRVHDASGERKTAENLFPELEKVLSDLQQSWNITVVAITSDAGGDALKGRKMAHRKYPHIVVPDCFGHQTNLIVGDFFRSKTYILALLREVQQTNSLRVLAVIRAVLTRWTAHYLAYRRLLEIRLSLQLLVENDEKLERKSQQLLLGDASTRERSRKNISVIKNSAFWHALARIKSFLEPLAIASNITQADNARVDIVLTTFGFLYIRYSKLLEAEDIKARDAILESIERRWLKTDQDVFVAGVLLNPFHKARPFRAAPFSTVAGLYNLLHRLWRRFYYVDPPAELYVEYKAYISGTGDFQAMHNLMDGMRRSAEIVGTKVNPLEVWEAMSHPDHQPTPLAQLARRILSICPNSASVERLWSVFGTILTRLRTQLGNKALLDIAELKLYLREEHLRARSVQTRLKRSFGTALEEDQSMPPPRITTAAVVVGAESALTADIPMEQDTSTPCGNDITDSVGQQSMRGIAQELIDAVETDDSAEPPEPSSNVLRLSIPIRNLFDFTQSYWVEAYEKLAMRGLQDELELYELLDLDAEGDTVENEADDVLNE